MIINEGVAWWTWWPVEEGGDLVDQTIDPRDGGEGGGGLDDDGVFFCSYRSN